MGLIPKRTKFRQAQRRRVRGKAARGNTLNLGEYGLQTLEAGWLKTRQVEAARRAITHHLKRGGKVWVRVCADKPYSARPAETRMGSGKGAPVGYVACIKAGHILFEVAGIPKDIAKQAMRLASYKLSFKTRFVSKEN